MTPTTTATPCTTVTSETIADAFVRTAREHAAREALSDGERSLTYEELDARTIDRDSDPEIGELVEVNLPDAGKERFIRVR